MVKLPPPAGICTSGVVVCGCVVNTGCCCCSYDSLERLIEFIGDIGSMWVSKQHVFGCIQKKITAQTNDQILKQMITIVPGLGSIIKLHSWDASIMSCIFIDPVLLLGTSCERNRICQIARSPLTAPFDNQTRKKKPLEISWCYSCISRKLLLKLCKYLKKSQCTKCAYPRRIIFVCTSTNHTSTKLLY